MPNKADTLAAIAAKHGLPDGFVTEEPIISSLLSEAYDAGRAAATEGAEVWWEIQYEHLGDWYSTGGQFDSVESARRRMTMYQDSDFTHRIVRKSLLTEVVE